ncbi:hypothetical protein [Marinobacter sp.]|uniref:hypothetical protein n=1 Tax=Marinobacter sp. TaxID=50741 RepID=UPI003A8F6E18
MANITGTPTFQDHVRQLETTDPRHPDTWNPNYNVLINNDVWLQQAIESTGLSVTEVAERVGSLEETSNVSVQRAVTLDWLYRDNRISFELWAPGFTLIDAVDTPILQAVSGDDSVDVQSTAQLRAGEFYVLSDAEGSLLIQCVSVLSENRIRVSANLTRGFASGVLSRCSLDQQGAAYAQGDVGDIWLSRPINIGADIEGGAVIIRRSLNSGEAHLYFRDQHHASWTERVWSVRRQGGDIPAGFADYEYILPMRGDGSLRLDIEGESMVVRHIVAISAATGLGGFTNPAMRPSAPAVTSPTDGATGLFERPTLAIGSYASPGDTPQAGLQFQVSTSSGFVTVHHDSGAKPAGLSYQMPAGVLATGTLYYVRARVQDASDLWSDWSAAATFTTAASFAYVSAPALLAPANNAADIGETPTLQTGAFAVVGGSDTHAASQWQVRGPAGTWTAPLWDSGEDATNLLSKTLPTGVLQAGQNVYYLRARHKGSSRGWSEYSSEVKITTKQAFASVAGVALITTGGDGGSWAYVDADGATVTAPGTAYFNAHPVFGGIQDVTIDGQAMVRIPKFYIKRGTIAAGANAGKEAWWVSDQPVSGYRLHPAFRNAGTDLDQIYVGKYQASMSGSKLASVPGVLPAVTRTLTQFQADATARNVSGVAGFMLWSVFHWSAIQWLYLIENATMNSQTKTGQGRVNATSAANVDATDVAQATYRGIVGLWGNVWQWMDGLKTVSGTINLWDQNGNKSWVSTKKRAAADGAIYPTTFMDGTGTGWDLEDVFIGDTGPTSNSNATAPDYQYMTSTGEFFPFVGGSWMGNAAAAGLWNLNVYYSASASSSYLGARLAKV